MPRPTLTANLIADLRQRVISHNEMAKGLGLPTTGLAELKKVYIGAHRGQDAASRAMTAVDRYLGRLAKAEEFDEAKHPRNKGRFAPKVTLASFVPADKKEHQQLQESNAGYHALTTDLVPEFRYRVAGAIGRKALAAGIGAVTIASLARGRPNGIVRRAAEWVGASAARYGGGLPLKSAAHVSAAGLRAVSSKARRKLTPDVVDASVARATNRLSDAGRMVGRGTADVAGKVVRGTMSLASRPPPGAKRTFRRAAAFTGLATIPGYAAGSAMQATVDPEQIGQVWDSVSYRTIEKIAASPNFEAARQAINASIRSAAGNDLSKVAGMYSTLGRSLFGTLAAAGGAAIGNAAARRAVLRGVALAGASAAGAAAGEKGEQTLERTGKKGNPYHDSKGRFTSHNAASIGGAIAGGALAGGAVLLALRSHNLKVFRGIAHAILDKKRAAIDEAATGFFGKGPHVAMRFKRATMIQDELAKDKIHLSQKEALDKYQNSASVHYIAKIREAVNKKIADGLVGHLDKVVLPTKNGAARGASVWKPVDEIVTGTSTAARMAKAHTTIMDAVDRMDDGDFDRSISALDPKIQDAARTLFRIRTQATNDVASEIASHEANIDNLAIALKDAQKVHKDALANVASAESTLKLADDANKESAKAVLASVENDEKVARKAVGKATIAHGNAQKAGAPIKDPISKKVIPPATEEQMDLRREKIALDAIGRAEKKVDAQIEGARQEHIAGLSQETNRQMAAEALLGLKRGSIPGRAKKAAKAFKVAHQNHIRQEAIVATAIEADANAAKALRSLKASKKSKFDPTNPDHVAIETKAKNADTALKAAQAELTVRETKQNEAAQAFHDVMVADREALEPKPGRMPSWIAENLKNDLKLATDGVKSAAATFLRLPGAATLKNFATRKFTEGKGQVSGAFVDTYNELFRRQTGKTGPDGKPELVHSIPKIVRNAALAGTVLEGGRELANFAKSKLFGSDEDATKAKLPNHFKVESPIDPITGVGYTAISVADPENKGDHLLLWGQRYEGDRAPTGLYAGGRMSLLRQRVAEQNQRQKDGRQGNLGVNSAPLKDAGIPNAIKTEIDAAIGKLKSAGKLRSAPAGPAGNVEYRDDSAVDQQGPAGKLMGELRTLLNTGDGTHAEKALRTMFSSQGRILGLRQAYEALTGYRTDGKPGSAKRGVLGMKNEGFASNDPSTVSEALGEELPKALSTHANEQEWKDHLHRAIGIIVAAKKLPRDTVESLHNLVSAQENQSKQKSAGPTPAPEPKTRERPRESAARLPSHWVHETLRDEADQAAESLTESFPGPTSTPDMERIRDSIEHLAITAHHRYPDELITEQEGVQAAFNLASMYADGDEGDVHNVKRALITGRLHGFSFGLDDELERILEEREYNRNNKSDDAGDLEKMLASFGLGKSDGGGASLPKVLLEGGAEGATALATREATRAQGGKPQEFFSGGRVAHELGAAVAADTGWQVALKIAQRFIPGSQIASNALQIAHSVETPVGRSVGGIAGHVAELAGKIKTAAQPRNIAVHGAALVGSSASGAAGGALADTMTGAQYNPGEENPEASVGRLGGSIAGDYGGATIGAAVARSGAATVGKTAFGRLAGQLVSRAAGALSARAIGGEVGATLGSAVPIVGTVLGGAAGSWLAGEAGSRIADYFAGHDADQVQRATSRYMSPHTSGRGIGIPRPTRISGVGVHGGNPNHDQRGRFSTFGAGV